MVFRHRVLAIAIMLLAGTSADAAVRCGSPFADHVVLQRDTADAVWGWADPGEEVSVRLADQTKAARADARGRWELRLDPLAAGGPYTLSVTGRSGNVTVNDVMVGEVWLASGQSNMEFHLPLAEDGKAETAAADYPMIRHFVQPRRLSAEPVATCDGKWEVCSPATAGDFSAVAYFFSRHLYRQLNVPVGIVTASYGGTPVESWMDRATIEGTPEGEAVFRRAAAYPAEYERLMARFKANTARVAATNPTAAKKLHPPESPDKYHQMPCVTYNGMIVPIRGYTVRGCIWYQGESNAIRAWQYRTLLPAMIRSWREQWGQGEFPFLMVQLANYHRPGPDPAGTAWAELRDAQSYVTRTAPNCGMAVTIDIGDPATIHPKNKQEVGRRLGLLAEHVAYERDVACTGPVYQSMRVDGAKAVLRFRSDGKLAVRGDRLDGFSIAGADGHFVAARVELAGDGEVVVSSTDVPAPVAVRYGWASDPVCNLYDASGLPASPFRTDDWPALTLNER